jgi:Ca2+-binding RTX toxin-like protein
VGGEGVDHLRGDSGNNVFDGGAGNDVLEGHDGADVYYFGTGDGLDVITDSGGSNIIKFGAGFSAESLKADIIDVSVGRVLRLFNGEGDAILIRNYEEWKNSTFTFSDGVILGYQEVMKKTLPAVDIIEPPAGDGVLAKEEDKDIIADEEQVAVPDQSGIVVPGEERSNAIDHNVGWTDRFLAELKATRSKSRHVTGFTLNNQGVWVRSYIATSDTGYITHTDVINESTETGTLSETPQWMEAATGDAVFSERQTNSTSQSSFREVKKEGTAAPSSLIPRYFRSGTASGFSFKIGDAIVADRNDSGAIEGWYIYPAESFAAGETVRREFRRDVTTETIKHKVVRGDDVGGRVNVEVGNLFQGGAGDDLIVAYSGVLLDYGYINDRIPGAFLSAGAGNDTLLGSEGADYLVSGAGDDYLYGENGADTYIVQAHAGATTIIADVLNPVFLRPEVGVAGWKDEYGLVDQDTVVLPEDATQENLQLSWGATLIEAVNVELAPDPRRDAFRHPPRAKMLYSTLDIKWGRSQKVRIVLPNAGDIKGSGIEVVKFADGSSVTLKELFGSSQLGPAPDTYHNGLLVDNAASAKSMRDGQALPLVGSHGNDTLSGAGEIRGMQGHDVLMGSVDDDVLLGGPGNDTLSGGAGNDLYKYDGLGRDLIDNTGGGIDGIDFSGVDLPIEQLRFHRDQDDLVIVVSYGMGPKIRVANHFSGGESAIGFIRVSGEGKTVQDYTAMQIAERLHPLPPLRDVEDILVKENEESRLALAEIIQFYELNM